MRVVTTAPKGAAYAQRWLDSRKNWPTDTEFLFYTEGYEVDCPGKDFRDLPEFSEWKLKHSRYRHPGWQWNVVGYAHKVFAACDAFYDYDGIGVWLDADCVTYKPIPEGLIESQVAEAYMAIYARQGLYTETGFWVMNCAHPAHKDFCDKWRAWYFGERYKKLPMWHDCMTLDMNLRQTGVPVKNLSEGAEKTMHPMAVTELGQYIDHCKGPRKVLGYSPENKHHQEARPVGRNPEPAYAKYKAMTPEERATLP